MKVLNIPKIHIQLDFDKSAFEHHLQYARDRLHKPDWVGTDQAKGKDRTYATYATPFTATYIYAPIHKVSNEKLQKYVDLWHKIAAEQEEQAFRSMYFGSYSTCSSSRNPVTGGTGFLTDESAAERLAKLADEILHPEQDDPIPVDGTVFEPQPEWSPVENEFEEIS